MCQYPRAKYLPNRMKCPMEKARSWKHPPAWNRHKRTLNRTISMIIFFFVNKIIFPEGQQKKD